MLTKQTLGSRLWAVAEAFPDSPAVRYLNQTICYGELNARVNGIAKGLLACRLGRGTHIGLVAGNRPSTLCFLYAALRIGAIPALIGERAGLASITECLDRVEATALICDDAAVCRAVKSERPACLAVCGGSRGETEPVPDGGILYLDELLSRGRAVGESALQSAASRVTPDDADLFLFTSGTTGIPKAVVTTHRSRLKNALDTARLNGIRREDRFCVALPMYHCFCLTASVLAAMTQGACLCFARDHHSENVLDTIVKNRCTVLHGVPTLFLAVVNRLRKQPADVSSLRMGMIGGAGYTPAQFLEIARALDFALLPSLGQTEATAGITVSRFEDSDAVKATTVGRLFPGLEARFCDPVSREILPEGQTGELCIRGYSVMQGYYGGDTATAIDPDGFLHTGDLGRMDGAGNISLAGRCKDVVIRGGENVMPAEIENALRSEPGIRDACVVGVPDDYYGEELCAFVVFSSREKRSTDALRARIGEKLPSYKIPKYMIPLDRLPVNETGKTDRRALRRIAADQTGGC